MINLEMFRLNIPMPLALKYRVASLPAAADDTLAETLTVPDEPIWLEEMLAAEFPGNLMSSNPTEVPL
jgi:hypothetical protein